MNTIDPTVPTESPPPVALTAQEFVRRYGSRFVELVRGVVKEAPLPFPKHGKTCARIASLLLAYADERDCAHVMTNDSWTQTGANPDTVRGPDVSYYGYDRLPKGPVPDGLLPVQPDLVVEVRSPSNGWIAIFLKVGEYLAAGVRVVVVLDAASESASVYRAEEFQQIFHNGDELVVPEVMPGFAVAVRRLFS